MKLSRFLVLLGIPFLLSIAAGEKAPDFSVKNQVGQEVRLSDFKGKYVLLYFYPKDETPGCTKEACRFRDDFAKLKKMNTVVLGVSRQDEKSHQKFIEHHHLPFDLLADTDGALAKAYGVGLMPIVGYAKRQSVLIGPDGKVMRFYKDVDPETHTDEVLKDLVKAGSYQ